MGTDKVFLKIRGKTFLEFLSEAALLYFDRIIISTDTGEHADRIGKLFPAEDDRIFIVTDKYQGAGPIGGILSVMEEYPGMDFTIVPVDVPQADMEALSVLKEIAEELKCRPLLIRTEDGVQPLIGHYSGEEKGRLKTAMQQGKFKLIAALDSYGEITPGELAERFPELSEEHIAESLKNINYKKDYLELI